LKIDSKPNPVENFFLRHLNQREIPWEKIEDEVYDVLFPTEIKRFTFDPEALIDYPNAELLDLGSPYLESFFKEAQSHGKRGRIFFEETHLSPFNLNKEIEKDLHLPKNFSLSLGQPRIFYFSMILFLFQVTYSSDEKEQALIPIGIDGYSKRPLRSLDASIESEPFQNTPSFPYPHAPTIPLSEAYSLAEKICQDKVKTSKTLLSQNLTTLFSKESTRIKNYFSQVKKELKEKKGEDPQKIAHQLEATELEKQRRLRDLEKKLELKVEVELSQFLEAYQLKFSIPAVIQSPSETLKLSIIWNPKLKQTEAFPCPQCHCHTFQLEEVKKRIGCFHCTSS